MFKDIIISAMAAVLAVDKLSCVISLTVREQVGLWIGITAIIIIFCLFLEIQVEKLRQRRARVRQLKQLIGRLIGKEEAFG